MSRSRWPIVALWLTWACSGPEDLAREPRGEPAGDLGPPEVVRLEALPAVLTSTGARAVLRWSVARAEQVRITSHPGDFVHDGPAEGQVETPPLAEETQFVLQASSAEGTDLAFVTVAVRPLGAGLIESFRGFPEVFAGRGTEVSLAWRARGRLELRANGAPVPDFPAQGSTWTTTIDAPTRFTLTAELDGRSASAEVAVLRSGEELEPNDGRDRAGRLAADGTARGRLEPADVDWYAVDVPDGAALRAEVTDPSGRCALDSRLELWGPDPERPGEIRYLAQADDAGGVRPCPLIDPLAEGGAADLPEGRFFLAVRGFDRDASGPYLLRVGVIPAGCGNGLVEVRRGESCDDGGRSDGDGCSAACTLEDVPTVRGPDVDASLEVRLDPARPAAAFVEGVRPGVLAAFTTDEDGRCPNALRLELRDPSRTGGAGLRLLDDGRRSPDCTLSPLELPAGRYLLLAVPAAGAVLRGALRVRLADRGCGDLRLDRSETCDDGNRVGGDGCSAACALEAVATATSGAPAVTVTLPDFAPRYVRVRIGQPGASLRAEAVGPASGEVQLSFHDEGFVERGIVPTGRPLVPGEHAFVDDLAPGTYVVGLRRSRPGTAQVGLQVTEVPPRCGDGLAQSNAGEHCDDAPGSPSGICSSTCRFVATDLEIGPLITISFREQKGAVFRVRTTTTTSLDVNLWDPSFGVCDARVEGQLRAYMFDGSGRRNPLPRVRIQPGRQECARFRAAVLRPGTVYIFIESLATEPLTVQANLSPYSQCGDRILDAREQCDDGSLPMVGPVGGDGCDRTCRFESGFLRETEPNDAFATANPLNISVGSPPAVPRGTVWSGDRDLYSFEVGRWEEATLRISTLGNSNFDRTQCLGDMFVRVFDAWGRLVAENDDGPHPPCSELVLSGAHRLFEGRYYISIEQNLPLRPSDPQYIMEVSLE